MSTVDPPPDWSVITGPVIEVPEIPDGISSGRRRTLKRLVMLELGKHPVTQIPLHPQAPEDASRRDRYPRDFTCGTCAHRVMVEWTSPEHYDEQRDEMFPTRLHRHPKCDRLVNRAHSATTDAPAWLPGCMGYKPIDNVASPALP